ncbi:MAG TPA: DUF1016 N-terminal domain-containing protein [Planctomycetaceae bacterium]|nr:DUF1016 N-terminal domain-containing protein [Planctomycetaceae bacterium]
MRLYWDIGQLIDERQRREGWGAAVIPRLAAELKNELPEFKGFSKRNIDRMIASYRDYPDAASISPQPVAKLGEAEKVPQPVAKFAGPEKVPQSAAQSAGTAFVQQVVAQMPVDGFWSVPWAHHVILMQKVKDLPTRRWYMEQTLANGWSRNILALQIDGHAHARR